MKLWITPLLASLCCCQLLGPVGPEELPACERACANLEKLGCEEAKPTPKGETCVQFCNKTQASELVSLNPQCVETIKECSAIDTCTGSE